MTLLGSGSGRGLDGLKTAMYQYNFQGGVPSYFMPWKAILSKYEFWKVNLLSNEYIWVNILADFHENAGWKIKTGCKPKRTRTIFTADQLERLEKEFDRQQYIVGSQRFYLAADLGLNETQVKIWFQNRRIKWRRQTLNAAGDSKTSRLDSDEEEKDQNLQKES